MGKNGDFSVKALKHMVNLKILGEEADTVETKWCKYIPSKVSVFMWRLKHGRLPIRALLDRYEMELDITLCPICNEVVESLDHFVSCSKVKSVWNKVFDWWSLDNFDGSSLADILNLDGNGIFPNSLNPVWQAVVW
nr:reverse transcriptase domain, reverse transcriptase zinc-binding domain protein [Tanacetum cinerariifolium]